MQASKQTNKPLDYHKGSNFNKQLGHLRLRGRKGKSWNFCLKLEGRYCGTEASTSEEGALLS